MKTTARDATRAAYVTPATAARRLGVSARTITRWCRAGHLDGAIQPAGYDSAWRIPLATLNALTPSPRVQDGRDAADDPAAA